MLRCWHVRLSPLNGLMRVAPPDVYYPTYMLHNVQIFYADTIYTIRRSIYYPEPEKRRIATVSLYMYNRKRKSRFFFAYLLRLGDSSLSLLYDQSRF